MKITEYSLHDLGIENSQYFQGFGSGSFEHAFCGIGDNPREALDDCLEQIATSGFDVEDLENRICADEGWKTLDDCPNSPSVSDEIEDEKDEYADHDIYYHVGIRFNAKPAE